MSDWSYRLIWHLGHPIVWVTSRPVILHAARAARPGGYLLAANHHGPYDVPALMAACPRDLDFLSIVEFRDKPLVGPFFRAMNCTFLDRSRRDPAAARQARDRLRAGRVVALFPEGGFRQPERSVTAGGPFNPGVVRLAKLGGVPIVPAVVLGTSVYSKFWSYRPTRSVRWGAAFGQPIHVTDPAAAAAELAAAFVSLHDELEQARAAVRRR